MADEQIRITEKHSRILRWSHWINFPLLSLMIWSGLLIYWANQAYIEIPPSLAFHLSIESRLAEGMGWHFLFMWGFFFNGLVYISYLLISGEWRSLAPDRHTLKEAFQVVLHDLKLSKVVPPMRGKFNAAQKLAYCAVIIMAIGSLITGLAVYRPVTFGWLTNLLGGYEAARLEHFILMVGYILFFIIHIIQVMRAGWNNFRSMIAGYEIERE
ncbi:cytochrome b/b6 domain-containing protein [Bacteriovorax sp. PP10]|uniref:Cytochrome b/b6 domain-containing protein n=1 Tax=Bacteriovorax antarcticus TaxID=3088717 RepID=A0ABU5VRW7_9BACT|nr:cytochrome b/b6 domain-containing protein [Bacteriovorax sp. PP10]MEA9355794.1 cytochrome b/b6 domain-containing protein [Bacteriovorax sp. PP10]